MFADKRKHKEYYKHYSKQYNQERYDILKIHGICVVCGCEDAFAGMTRCPQCLKNNTLNKSHDLEHNNKLQRKRRKKKKAAGICQDCSLPVYEGSKLFCKEHHEKHKAKNRIYAANRRAKTNKTLLPKEALYSIQCQNAEKARTSENFKKHLEKLKTRISVVVNHIKLRKKLKEEKING